jgi:hypothetical protein
MGMLFVSPYRELDFYITIDKERRLCRFHNYVLQIEDDNLSYAMKSDVRYGSDIFTAEEYVNHSKPDSNKKLYQLCTKLAIQEAKGGRHNDVPVPKKTVSKLESEPDWTEKPITIPKTGAGRPKSK